MNKKTLLRLFAEWREDAAQRILRDRGVQYQDEPNALRGILEGRIQGTDVPKKREEQELGGVEL